eukprot:jgi/Galph1/4449/GphlegSOOS_G3035.1
MSTPWQVLPQRQVFRKYNQQNTSALPLPNNPDSQGKMTTSNQLVDCIKGASVSPSKTISHELQDLSPTAGYEYLDHTADVQIHCWGNTWEEAFEAAGLALFDYMTDIRTVKADPSIGQLKIQAQGHDLDSLLYRFLDNCLYLYGSNYYILCHLKVTCLQLEEYKIEAIGEGEVFQRDRHPQGTEIKAITYSAMQLLQEEGIHIYYIVDI